MFAPLSIDEPPIAVLDPVALRKVSPTAPNAIEVANPPYSQILPNRDEGTLDSRSLNCFEGLATILSSICLQPVSLSVKLTL